MKAKTKEILFHNVISYKNNSYLIIHQSLAYEITTDDVWSEGPFFFM